MGNLASLATTMVPDLARYLTGDAEGATNAAIADAVQSVTGTADAEGASAALERDPSLSTRLHVLLAGVAAAQDRVARAAELSDMAATIQASAALPGVMAASSATPAWAALAISAAILSTFGVVMALVLRYGMPAGSETTSNMLLGTLAAMATSVVSYWVGSSAGSARKDDRLAQAGK